MKVIFDESSEIEAEEILKNKKIKSFGTGGGHIIVPNKYTNREATVIIHTQTGSWANHMRKKNKTEMR